VVRGRQVVSALHLPQQRRRDARRRLVRRRRVVVLVVADAGRQLTEDALVEGGPVVGAPLPALALLQPDM
jgi:hypothetical protein